jgi:hypothetical protein
VQETEAHWPGRDAGPGPQPPQVCRRIWQLSLWHTNACWRCTWRRYNNSAHPLLCVCRHCILDAAHAVCALWQALSVCLYQIAPHLCCRLIVLNKAYMVGSDPSILFALAVRLNVDTWVEAAHGDLKQVAISGYHAPLTPVPAAVPVLARWTHAAVMLESMLSKPVSAPCCRGPARRCATFCGTRVSGLWRGIPTNTALQQTARGWAHPGATCLVDC